MGDVLRLLSMNLQNGAADPYAAAALVERVNADVCALQELAPRQARAISDVLPHGRLDPATDFFGMGIALRHEARVERLPLAGRDGFRAWLAGDTWARREPLEVVNLHLLAPHSWPFWRILRARRTQVRQARERLGSPDTRARAILGDLNATPLWPAYRRLAAGHTDAAQLAARRMGERPRRTWGPWSGSPRLLRIDHALVSGVDVSAVRVLPIEGSDHSALLLEIERDASPIGRSR